MIAFLELIQKLLTFGFGVSLIGNTSTELETPDFKSAFEHLNYGHSIYIEYDRQHYEYGWLHYEGRTYNLQKIKVIKDIINWEEDTTKVGEIVFGANSFVNQAKKIDVQEAYTCMNISWKKFIFQAGFSELWTALGHPSPCAKVGIDYDGMLKLYGHLTTNFNDRRIIELGAMQSFRIKNGIIIEIGMEGQQAEQCFLAYRTNLKLDIGELFKWEDSKK